MNEIDKIKRTFVYDPQTGIIRWRDPRKYPKTKADGSTGCPNKRGYLVINWNYKGFYAHRLAWILNYGVMPSGQIDHINGDRMDNRISNLRDVSAKENANNRYAEGAFPYLST